jgi:hypothetical protein
VSSTPMKGLFKIPLEPDSKPLPGKVSEMILEFAQPLMEFGPGGPPNIQTMRSIMMFAMICWNLPIMESRTDVDGASARKMFDDAMAGVPESLGRVLLKLIEDRKTRFAMVPFCVTVQVAGTSMEDARVVAQARMPGVPATRH